MKVVLIISALLPTLALGDSTGESAVWTFENAGTNYFCTTEKPTLSSRTIRIESMSSLTLNRRNICYKCCVKDLDKNICDKTPYKASYGLAAQGKSCGCQSVE